MTDLATIPIGTMLFTQRKCAVETCDRPSRSRGWCEKHYQKWWTYGDPLASAPREDHRVLFLSHVQIDPSGCWLWTAQLTSAGYGRCAGYGLGTRLAHRVAWLMFVGPLDQDQELDHVWANGCRNRHCVNWIDHLEPVTHRENILRYVAVKPPLDRCRRAGHPYDETNTRWDALGHPVCRACDKTPERKAKDAERKRVKRARERQARG